MLSNPMEEKQLDKQLDFNAPLLSVRRFSSTSASSSGEHRKTIGRSVRKIPSLSFYKPELKSGPVNNPGAVPFLWEQIPGRPKDGNGSEPQSLGLPPLAPKLPPGRVLSIKQQSSNRNSEDPNVVRRQTENVFPTNRQVSSSADNVTKFESSKEVMKDKEDTDTEEDDNEAFTDALDTLSRTESFFLNCSVTGLSGFDGPDVKPSGTFSTDPQTRDFMMGRFLPAAKAMAAETPKYASRKQPLAHEQSRQVKKVVGGDRRPPFYKKVVSGDRQSPFYQSRPNVIPQYVKDKGEEESDEEDDDVDYDDTGNLSKACGLLPRFCLKNSFCLLNPVPGMKVMTQVPMSSVCKAHTQVKTAYIRSRSETDDEHTWDAVYKHKLVSELEPAGFLEDESKLTSESNLLTYWSDSQTPDGSSPCRRSGGGGISPYRNEAPQSPFHEGLGFLGIPKEVNNFRANGFNSFDKGHDKFREVLCHQSNKQGSGSISPILEKTLYVDSVHAAETWISNSSSSDTTGVMDTSDKDSGILVESRIEETPAVDSCLGDINDLNISKERSIFQPKISEVVNADLPCSSGRSVLGGHMDRIDSFRQDGYGQESKSVVCSKVPPDGILDSENPHLLKADYQGNSYVSSLHSPLAPPLPKSPSESWLCRTLPSITSRNPSLRSYQGTQFDPRKQGPKTSSVNPKWETIVKTSNVHHDHLRFSEELITPVSQQSETLK